MSILYSSRIRITDTISVEIPVLADIIDNEDTYYENLFSIIASPYEMMVQLDDVGIDFTKITDYELFLMMFPKIQNSDTHLLFGELDLCKFKVAVNQENNEIVLHNPEDNIVIDQAIYRDIANALRRINDIEPCTKRPGNEAARKYLIERTRIKQKRAARKKKTSQLDPYIVALVNTQEFKYDYDSIRNLTLYQFHESLKQVVKIKNYDHLMAGCYAGNVDIKKIDKNELTWISV